MLFESPKNLFQSKVLTESELPEFLDLVLGVLVQELVEHDVATSCSEEKLSIRHLGIDDLACEEVLALSDSLHWQLEAYLRVRPSSRLNSSCLFLNGVLSINVPSQLVNILVLVF